MSVTKSVIPAAQLASTSTTSKTSELEATSNSAPLNHAQGIEDESSTLNCEDSQAGGFGTESPGANGKATSEDQYRLNPALETLPSDVNTSETVPDVATSWPGKFCPVKTPNTTPAETAPS